MSDCKVLLVDDEVDFVEVLSDRLEARGLSVVKAHSGEQALEAAEGRVFDAIVLDMAMPGMDGIETLEGLLKINPVLQVILLTGKATLEQAAAAIRTGALDLLEKPADIDTLVAKIEMAATRRWSMEEKRIELKVADIIRKKGW
ncbi:MAG: response regulator [Longimicrobiales bacterium]|nr:response regulator [Longimicrobiales bacterium]